MIAALVAAALVGQGASGAIMPGVLDLPMLEGATPAPECLGFRDRLSEGDETFECLGAPVGRINDLIFAYRGAALERGWADAGGAASAIWLTRNLPDGTCQRLTIGGMWDFERTPEPRDSDPGLVLIMLDAEARCPAPSAAR